VDRFNARQAHTPEQLEALGEQLAAAGLGGAMGAMPTPVHEKAVDVLTKLVQLGATTMDDDTPVMLRTLVRGLEHTRPMLVQTFAKTDTQTVLNFMAALMGDLQSIIDEGAQHGVYPQPPNLPDTGPHDTHDAAAGYGAG
jgi:hypothetical protein